MENDIKEEKAVEVILPDDPITEVELQDNSATVKEQAPKVTEKDPEVEQPRASVDEREKALQDLKAQYERQKLIAQAERDARKKAEEYARQQAERAHSAQNEVQDGNLKIILNAIDATEQAAAGAERDYAEAMASGNYAAAAKAQRLMAQAESHLLQLNNGKQKLEEMLQQPAEGAVTDQQFPSFEPAVPQDPVEVYAQRLAPKSAQWLRNHPEVVSENKVGKLTRAHQDAVEDGLVAESPEYFRYIEARLGYDTPAQYEEPARESAPAREAPRKSLVSAPVTSNASVMSSRQSGNSNTMVLSPEQVEFALMAEPDLPRDKAIEAYARNRAFLIKNGKLSA
jgi:hypothetical protein